MRSFLVASFLDALGEPEHFDLRRVRWRLISSSRGFC